MEKVSFKGWLYLGLYLKHVTWREIKADLDEVHGTFSPVSQQLACTHPYIHETWTSFGTSSGSDYLLTKSLAKQRYGFSTLKLFWNFFVRIPTNFYVTTVGGSWRHYYYIFRRRRKRLINQPVRDVFLWFTQNYIHRLLGKRKNDNWRVICIVIAPAKQKNKEKSFFGKEKFSFIKTMHGCAPVSVLIIRWLKKVREKFRKVYRAKRRCAEFFSIFLR